jgi:hypothetical protein
MFSLIAPSTQLHRNRQKLPTIIQSRSIFTLQNATQERFYIVSQTSKKIAPNLQGVIESCTDI